MTTANKMELAQVFDEFLDDYYRDEIGKLAQKYPKDQQSLYVEARDVYRKDPTLLDDFIEHPDQFTEYLEEALRNYDIPADVSLGGAHVRVTDHNDYLNRRGLDSLNQDDLGRLVAVRCQLGKVSERKPRLRVGAFECQRCGNLNRIPQSFTEGQEPHECQSCERQGPFNLNDSQSEWVDQRKIQLETPPEVKSGAEIVAYCLDDLADPPGVDIQEKAGSRVTVIGKLEADKSSLFGRNSEPVADEYFIPHSFVWGDNLTNEVDVDDYREQVTEVASHPDAIELFKQNIDPSLVITDDWEDALEMGTVWLFAGPRIDPPEGDTIRGDLHMLFVSDPGMNKSDFASKLAELSPKALVKDAEGMSSSVALTAAATQGGFGDDSWSIEPGALPKANKGHLILDEIDKGPDGFLEGIHSPLEGNQTLNVEKAGEEANLATRCGFLALGNPTDGRFDPYEPIAEQVDLHPALMSRFDLICTMEDTPDRETDEAIAAGVLNSIDESARLDHGELDHEDANAVAGEVDRDVMKAWVKLARQEIHPLLTEDAKEVLREFYVDTRQLNGEESEKTPTTARKLVGGVRIAMALARVELSESVEKEHAKRAVELSKKVIRHNHDPESGEFDANRTTEQPSSQQERVKTIIKAIQDDQKTPTEIKQATGIDMDVIEHRLEKLSQKGAVVNPAGDEWRAV